MKKHASPNYICPICLGIQGIENENTLIRDSDILFIDEFIMVFVASYFIKGSEGHLIVVPIDHFENFYDLPDQIGSKIFSVAKKFAKKMKAAYDCDGINILQNNEPAAGQHAFHYHMHLFPRFKGDNIWDEMAHKRVTTQKERLKFVKLFK